jgi:hypothetical protein
LLRHSLFVSRYPLTQTGPQFVDAVLLTVRNSSNLDLSSRAGDLNNEYNLGTNQTDSRARVMIRVIEYDEYRQAEFNPGFVLAEYFGYLRRDPDEGGLAFWLNVLNQTPGNFRGMVCAFINSGEYQARFSSIITRDDRQCGP